MPRRSRPPRREIEPDIKYDSVMVARFINKLMMRGKKSIAERILYDAFDIIESRVHKNPLDVFEQAVNNAAPILEVKPRRVGGATYQVPVEVRPERRISLAMRWLVQNARKRAGKSMAEKLAAELMDAARGQGATIKKKEDTHKMAEANRAFAHYRW
ncbi:MAG TPA: 30S ribosomal protein S7 [Anaerolineae bacterium]|nr:30S ribosomal protein S7 [Anaerolineae bacterium]